MLKLFSLSSFTDPNRQTAILTETFFVDIPNAAFVHCEKGAPTYIPITFIQKMYFVCKLHGGINYFVLYLICTRQIK